MLGRIIIGQYLPGDSYVHRLDPRAKMILTILLMVAAFLIKNWVGNLLMVLLLAAAIGVARVPLRLIFRGLRTLLWLVLLTFILHLFFTPGETLLFLGPFAVSREGLTQGILIGLRLTYVLVLTSVLTLTTSPISLADGLEHLLNPLKAIKVPVHELAMMMSIALRFIPTLAEEADKIFKAQMSRGADFSSGNPWQRARGLVPVLVPLFVSAFRRADELAAAMEARCYRGGQGRTRMKQLHLGYQDAVALTLGLMVLTGIVAARFA